MVEEARLRMIEVTAVLNAQHRRSLLDAQRRLDQQRAEVVQSREKVYKDSQRRHQIIEQRVELDAQRIRDRRNDIEFETEAQRAFDEQQRVLDTIDNDTLFERKQIAIQDELNSSRDSREFSEVLLLRDLEASRNNNIEREELTQRTKDQHQAQIERENRVIERRIAQRDADIQARIDLRVSLDRISLMGGGPLRAQDATPGNLLDVQA